MIFYLFIFRKRLKSLVNSRFPLTMPVLLLFRSIFTISTSVLTAKNATNLSCGWQKPYTYLTRASCFHNWRLKNWGLNKLKRLLCLPGILSFFRGNILMACNSTAGSSKPHNQINFGLKYERGVQSVVTTPISGAPAMLSAWECW